MYIKPVLRKLSKVATTKCFSAKGVCGSMRSEFRKFQLEHDGPTSSTLLEVDAEYPAGYPGTHTQLILNELVNLILIIEIESETAMNGDRIFWVANVKQRANYILAKIKSFEEDHGMETFT